MIDELRKNVDTEIGILREISSYTNRLEYSDESEKKLLLGAITSLEHGMKIINQSIPKILADVSPVKKLPSAAKAGRKRRVKLEGVKFGRAGTEIDVVLSKESKERLLDELRIGEQFITKLRKKRSGEKERYEEFEGSRGYLKVANRLFLRQASKLAKKGSFKSLSVEIRKSNIDILFESYIALILFSVFLSVIFSLLLVVFLLFIDVGVSWPFLEIYQGSYLARIGRIFWILLVVPSIVFLGLYFYPSSEKKSLGQRVNQELPFAVIHMSAISGSGIAPSEIFRIIGLSKEYPYLRKEIRKVLNQINLYGYNLVTALNNASKTSPSEKLGELFSGLSITITSGANLSEFFEKRAESLMLSYKLEREKYTKLVETFLDIYISIVIAAPMIFLLLIVMMLISGIDVGLSSAQISLLAIATISLLNVFFLIFLKMKQPSY